MSINPIMVQGHTRMSIPQLRRQRQLTEAEGYLELGMSQQALALLDRLKEQSEDDSNVAYLKGDALRALERYDEALVELERASDLAPENVHIHLALGWCYKRTGRLDLAIHALKEALETNVEGDSTEALIRYNLACYYSLSCDRDRALAYLRTALAIESDYRDMIDIEPDFDPIRDDPEFAELATVIV